MCSKIVIDTRAKAKFVKKKDFFLSPPHRSVSLVFVRLMASTMESCVYVCVHVGGHDFIETDSICKRTLRNIFSSEVNFILSLSLPKYERAFLNESRQ